MMINIGWSLAVLAGSWVSVVSKTHPNPAVTWSCGPTAMLPSSSPGAQ
ncbi:hypothetical protein [Paeniglutamicibacter antarcticus]